ncbi:MAG: hypothetical protein QE290_03715 [Acidovorax sp.]|uniref:hypothetical protein n=1 Tax=Acidovorax sp. TaxID=1872122 RepID=UPI00261F959E|nr:hypothetical protein [Acidovorax sp.]MDH4463127.1 hypothetical protein [Acidovorax sp.]
MFADDFDPVAALAAETCPRCHSVGLTNINSETYEASSEVDRHPVKFTVCPSLYARCAACGLVGEWPDMSNP